MNKIIVRELPNEDVAEMDILVVNEDGEIIAQDSLSGYDFCAETLVELFAITKQYAPFTLHFITEDDVNKYLALAPISEYPEVDEDEEEDGCNGCPDTSCSYNPDYDLYSDPSDDDEWEDEDDEDYEDEEDELDEDELDADYELSVIPAPVPVTSLASLFANLETEPSAIEDASRD